MTFFKLSSRAFNYFSPIVPGYNCGEIVHKEICAMQTKKSLPVNCDFLTDLPVGQNVSQL